MEAGGGGGRSVQIPGVLPVIPGELTGLYEPVKISYVPISIPFVMNMKISKFVF